MESFARLLFYASAIVVVTAAAALVVGAIKSTRLPRLEVWHTTKVDADFSAADLRQGMDLSVYLEVENRVFEQVDDILASREHKSSGEALSRYSPNGVNNPTNFPRNWNRSFEMRPRELRGAALLLHGLTDSPYSLRSVAEVLAGQGFYVLGLRLPGHGTFPSGIARLSWQDYMAAVGIGATHVSNAVGGSAPFWIVGYSNGGALALKYALDALDDEKLSTPDRLVLISPAIGVTRFATLGRLHRALSFLPFFKKFRWLHVYPEYDPFKYVSFPKHAGYQTHLLTMATRDHLHRVDRAGRIAEIPPILAFQSLADATVQTEAVVDDLFAKLPDNGSELVIFDINRVSYMKEFFAVDPMQRMSLLERHPHTSFRLTVITNSSGDSREVIAKSWPPGSESATSESLGLEWPLEVFSLSHVALPFAPDDPIYGCDSGAEPSFGLQLGSLEPRGERTILKVPADLYMRLRHNPFFPYMEKRIIEAAKR